MRDNHLGFSQTNRVSSYAVLSFAIVWICRLRPLLLALFSFCHVQIWADSQVIMALFESGCTVVCVTFFSYGAGRLSLRVFRALGGFFGVGDCGSEWREVGDCVIFLLCRSR